MKKIFALGLCLTMSLFMFNCSDDDSDNNDDANNNSSSENVLVYNGEQHQLKGAVLANYGEWQAGVYNFDVTLVDTELSMEFGFPVPENMIFTGIYFELFTDNQDGLEPGTYTYSPDEVLPNTFDYGDVVVNYNFETDEDEGYFEITSGTFTILENGTTYKVEFEGTTNQGAEFSGYYEGEMVYMDESEGRMSAGTVKNNPFTKRK